VPSTTTTINRDQRDGLFEVIHNHLALVQDFWAAMQGTEDGATAERLGLEFAEDFRLLQDIGWSEKDERETFDLTMPAHDLMELLQRLHGEAVGVLVESGTEAQASREDAATDRRFQVAYEVCTKLLAELDPREARTGVPTPRRRRSACPHEQAP
jgi:hypothetical protein